VECADQTRIYAPILGQHLAGLRVDQRRVLEINDPRRTGRRQRRGLEIDPPKKLVLSWANQFMPEMQAEGPSRLTYELEQQGDMVKLTLVHEIDKPESKLIGAVSNGWPAILASLKSLLETGESLEATRRCPKDIRPGFKKARALLRRQFSLLPCRPAMRYAILAVDFRRRRRRVTAGLTVSRILVPAPERRYAK